MFMFTDFYQETFKRCACSSPDLAASLSTPERASQRAGRVGQAELCRVG